MTSVGVTHSFQQIILKKGILKSPQNELLYSNGMSTRKLWSDIITGRMVFTHPLCEQHYRVTLGKRTK